MAPRIPVWTRMDTQYLLSHFFSMLFVMCLLAAFQIVYFHVILSYNVAEGIMGGVVNTLDTSISSVFTNQTAYIKESFLYVARAAQYYVAPLYTYVQALTDRANAAERVNDTGRMYQIWLAEITIACVLMYAMLRIAQVAYP